jgi:multicomponent Na+:H+ antiporter subunit E
MARPAAARGAAAWRGALLFAGWVVLVGPGAVDAGVGLATAALATWASLRLLPPQPVRLRLVALPGLVLRFLGQSVLAGFDVARRAFDPRLPLRPGFRSYATAFAPGAGRSAFAALTSLLPGTVPAGEEGGALVYHCLDVGQPVAEQLAAEEAALRRASTAPALPRGAPR